MKRVYLKGYSNYPIPYLDITEYEFDRNVLNLLKKQIVNDYCVLPLDIFGNILTVVVANPIIETINILERLTNKKIRIFKSTTNQIFDKIKKLY